MQRYTPSHTPRAAFGMAALALTAVTFALTVVAPAQPGGAEAARSATLAAAPARPAATPVAIHPGRIDVIGIRPAVIAHDQALATGRQPS